MDAPVRLRGRARRRRRSERDGDRRELRRVRHEDDSRRAPTRPDRARRLLARPRPLYPGPARGAPCPPRPRRRRAVDLPAGGGRCAGDVRERMRSARLLVCIVAITGGLAAGLVLVPRALHGLRALTFPPLAAPGPHATRTRRRPPSTGGAPLGRGATPGG